MDDSAFDLIEQKARSRGPEAAFDCVAELARRERDYHLLLGSQILRVRHRLKLMARRLAEKEVRFVQVYAGGGGNWDTHNNIQGQIPGLCEYIDQGIAGLLTDLDQRGMLKDTLVICSSEFGRLPTIEAKNSKPGRDHNPYGFSLWMAGAGLKAGFDYGQTDELGYAAVQDFKCTHSHIHATVQYLLGVDYKKNTFPYEGRDESLVGVNPARVMTELLA